LATASYVAAFSISQFDLYCF